MLVADEVYYFCIRNKLKPTLDHSGDYHITKVQRNDDILIAFHLFEIESNCVFVKIFSDTGDLYVCKFQNTLEVA